MNFPKATNPPVFHRERQGRCLGSENCSFCAQSSFYNKPARPNTASWIPNRSRKTLIEANKNGVTLVGLVAAWKGLNEGPILDEVCDRIRVEMKAGGKRRPDGSLGIIKNQRVADRLKRGGLGMLRPQPGKLAPFLSPEPARRTPSTTASRPSQPYLKKAGIKNLLRRHHRHGRNARRPALRTRVHLEGNRRERRARQHPQSHCRHAVREKHAASAAGNFVFRLLPASSCRGRKSWSPAGCREPARHAKAMVFMAGASALMVGQLFDHPQSARRKRLQMLRDLGLDPSWDSHGFSDQQEGVCGCENGKCDTEAVSA